jgi:HEAT repeat protein
VAVLRTASDDAVPEVARVAWSIRCRSSEDAVALVAELERTAAAGRLGERLWDLLGQRPDDAAVQAAVLRLADAASDERRTAVFRSLWHWEAPPAVLLRIRAALGDPCRDVRRATARHLGDHGTADDIPALLALLRDGDAGVRMAAFRAVGRRVVNNEHPQADDGRPHWSDPAIQAAVLRYARDPEMTADERLSAGWRLTDPATHRAVSRELLAVADALPESDRRNAKGDQYMRTLWPRTYAHAHLVHRWLTAAMDETASYESDGSLQERPALLALLLQAMRDNAEIAAALPILERSLASRELAHATLLLIEEIGPPAAPLADALIAFRPSAKDCERWHVLSALRALGPAVADRALPLIREAALDPVDGWRAQRLLEPESPPPPPTHPGTPSFLGQP